MWKIVVPAVAVALLLGGAAVYQARELRDSRSQVSDLQEQLELLEAEVAILSIPEPDDTEAELRTLRARADSLEESVLLVEDRVLTLERNLESLERQQQFRDVSVPAESIVNPPGCLWGDPAFWDFSGLSC
jgi:hypothetical protein